MQLSLSFSPSLQDMEAALLAQDTRYDGAFFVAGWATGMFCCPACGLAPRGNSIEFFTELKQVIRAGYRPCRHCRPMANAKDLPPWVKPMRQRVEAAPELPLTAEDWETWGITPRLASRWFQSHYGLTWPEWCSLHRIPRHQPAPQVRTAGAQPKPILEACLRPPQVGCFRAEAEGPMAIQWLATPLGPLLAGATDAGICRLQFADPQAFHAFTAAEPPIQAADHPHLNTLRQELDHYFVGQGADFSVPLAVEGTPFQKAVWTEIRRIPAGETLSYQDLAGRLGQPNAVRAVARANGQNPVNILTPCHRVMGKQGRLTGYNGGLWRKRLLLLLEQTGAIPRYAG